MLLRRIWNRKRLDIRSAHDFNFLCFLFRKRLDDHGIVYRVNLRLMDLCQFLHIITQDILSGCKGS